MDIETTKNQLNELVNQINSKSTEIVFKFNQQDVKKENMSITGGNGRLRIKPANNCYHISLSGKSLEKNMYAFMRDLCGKECDGYKQRNESKDKKDNPFWKVNDFEIVRKAAYYYAELDPVSVSADSPNDFIKRELDEITENPDLDQTEKETLINARLGQGKFRELLINQWEGRCAITGFENTQLLIASHIKPWRDCSNSKERLDPNNGLLLIPNFDKVFDLGLITFNKNGCIKISSKLKMAKKLGIDENMKVMLNEKQAEFMKYHRKQVFED